MIVPPLSYYEFFAKIQPLFHPRGVRCGHVAGLDVGSECVGIVEEQVDAEGAADGEELLGVQAGLVEELLEGAGGDADAIGEPLVGVARAAQLVADEVADVDLLHGGCRYCAGYRSYTPTTADIKEGEQLRLQSAVVGITFYG